MNEGNRPDFEALVRRHEDHHFNPWRVPASARMAAVVTEITEQVANYERHKGIRQRARTLASRQTFEAIVTAVVCDLACHHIAKRAGGVAISRSKRTLGKHSIYKAPAETEMLPTILDYLQSPEMAFIGQRKAASGYDADGRTVIMPGRYLISRIGDFDFNDLGYSLDAQAVELRAEKERDDKAGARLEYDDTAETIRYRRELREINEWLAAADIDFDESVAPGAFVDGNKRSLRRIFNGSFEAGGRLFGGFWQELSKKQRSEGILIGGETTVTFDYGQMAPRILYGMAGVKAPAGDLYRVPGLDREGVKKVFNALLSADKPLKRRPKNTAELLPAGPFPDIVARIAAAHPAIAHQFGTGAGLRAMFVESQIIVRVLLDLKSEGIVALPVHDAILVKASDANSAEKSMKLAAKAVAGIEAVVGRSDPS